MTRNIVFCLFTISVCVAFAGEINQTFNYQGRFSDIHGKVKTGIIGLRFQIYSPDAQCLLYEESDTNISLNANNGIVNVKVGSPMSSNKRTGNDPGFKMARIFSNDSTEFGSRNLCSNGYKPQSGDSRLLRVFLIEGGKETALQPDQVISSVPTSMVAETIQGQSLEDLDLRYFKADKIGVLDSGKYCRADGNKILCDKDIAGLQASQGSMGPQGPAGAVGPRGPVGAAGTIGPQGPVGPAGAIGPQGIAGIKGEKGANGEVGPQGAAGPRGPQGPAGAAGTIGPQGIAGNRGEKGERGEVGPQGPAGPAGAMGPQGVAGPAGAMGPQGPAGKGLASVGTTCPDGQYVKGFNSNGNLICQALPAMTTMGDWVSYPTNNSVNLANSDGLVVVTSCLNCNVQISTAMSKSGSCSGVSLVSRLYISKRDKYGQGYEAATLPVRKGECWKVDSGTTSIFFKPM